MSTASAWLSSLEPRRRILGALRSAAGLGPREEKGRKEEEERKRRFGAEVLPPHTCPLARCPAPAHTHTREQVKRSHVKRSRSSDPPALPLRLHTVTSALRLPLPAQSVSRTAGISHSGASAHCSAARRILRNPYYSLPTTRVLEYSSTTIPFTSWNILPISIIKRAYIIDIIIN